MWYLEGFRAQNFQTFKDIEYCIEQGVTTLIFGENLDNPIQKSNGSGKSTIGEIIVVGTRGTPMKNVRIDEVINNNQNKAMTEVVYRNDQTDELMIITRELYKKSTNTVSLYMEKDGVALPPEHYTQASSADYSDFIFKTLGISEEEFLNNFVISRHRYVSFLDASDRTKKEIINKLSNVDKIMSPANDLLKLDIEHLEKEVEEANKNLATTNGAIQALESQITKLQEKSGTESKKEKEEAIKKQIQQYTDELFDLTESLKTKKSVKSAVIKADEIVGSIQEDWDMAQIQEFLEGSINKDSHPVTYSSIESCLNTLRAENHAISSYNDEIQVKVTDINSANDEMAELSRELDTENDKIANIREQVKNSQQLIQSSKQEIQDKYIELKGESEKISQKISDNKKKILIFDKEIGKLNNVLAGTITCPKCSHKFLLDKEISFEEASNKIKELKDEDNKVGSVILELTKIQDGITKDISETTNKKLELEDKLQKQIQDIESELPAINSRVDNIKNKIRDKRSYIEQLKNAMSNINQSITNINNGILSTIDNIIYTQADKINNDIQDITQKIAYKKQALETSKEGFKQLLESTIEDNIMSLKEDVAKYQVDRTKYNQEYDRLNNTFESLKKQTVNFANFKTYLANTKIEALSQEINTFLENTGSDIRVELSGYTKTKSGETRERISVSIVRNGINFGSYGKLSEGEKATAQVATILAQLKLININAPSTKGLNLLVIDEILDMIDNKGLSRIFNVLNDEGITSLIISHGMTNENYPHKALVRKKHGISSIDNL